MKHRRISKLVSLLVAISLAFAACTNGEDDSAGELEVPPTSTLQSDDERIGRQCSEAAAHVYPIIKTLSEVTPEEITAVSIDPENPITEAVEEVALPFTANDQKALNFACELRGQHDIASELERQGNSGDACDVWEPAYADVRRMNDEIGDVTILHPLSHFMFAASTAEINYGNGLCTARQNN